MPSAPEIIDGLTRLAQTWLPTAVLWHIVLAGALFALVKGVWRPSARVAALAASTPITSAAAFAWVGRNPFNAVVLAVATLALAACALRLGRARTHLGSLGARWCGAGLVLFGWLYPHFLAGQPIWMYAIASPIGLVPCPSLCISIGLGLYADAFGSRAWGLIAGTLGLFYGIVGVAWLGIWIDLPLLAGAAFLLVVGARAKTRTENRRSVHSLPLPGWPDDPVDRQRSDRRCPRSLRRITRAPARRQESSARVPDCRAYGPDLSRLHRAARARRRARCARIAVRHREEHRHRDRTTRPHRALGDARSAAG